MNNALGAISVPPGYTDSSAYSAGGNPYGASITVDENGNMQEDVDEAVKHQANRTAMIASWIKNGKQ